MGTTEADFPTDLRALEREYELIRELGQGGMAAVYLARHLTTGRLVAIKAIRARYLDDPDALQRFGREARTVAGLDHPNIVRTYSIEQIDDRAIAIIMEHVSGGTVRDRLREHGSLGAEHAEAVLRDVASALRYAHQRGIVHRDVKPENIFLDAARGRALLSDFGIARHINGDTDITLLGAALGTPQYMSPEQIDGAVVDGRSDIYSLGVLGWELLTGRRPWAGESLYGVIYKQKHEDLPRITSLRPRVPANLLFAVEGALVKDKTRRWQTVDEFLNQLTYNPPPVLAGAFPPGVAPPADEPTVRFRVPGSEASTEASGGTSEDTSAEEAVPSRAEADPPTTPISMRELEGAEVAGIGASATRVTAAAEGGHDYQLPEFAFAAYSDADWARRFGRDRTLRALGFLVPLAIAGVSLFVVLGGSGKGSPRLSRPGVTSSAGTVAADSERAPDSAAPRTVPTVSHAGDPVRTGSAPAAESTSSVIGAVPPRGADQSPRTPGIANTAARASSTRGSSGRVSRSRDEGAAAPTPARVDASVDARAARDPRSEIVRADSTPVTLSPSDTAPDDPFRPPTVALPAGGAESRTGASSAPEGASVVPIPRCRVASTADQQACLLAYIAVNDAPLQRTYDSLIGELRRLAGSDAGEPDPPAVQRLRVEQRAWISVRDGECRRQPLTRETPFWAQERSLCFSEMSAARAAELGDALRRVRKRR